MTTEHNNTDDASSDRLGFNNNQRPMLSLNFLMMTIGSHGAVSPPTS